MKKTKVKRIFCIFIIFILLISFSAILYATGAVINDPINLKFEDDNLYKAIKNKFLSDKITFKCDDSTRNIEVSKNNVNEITELNLQGIDGAQIQSLTGLENFVNLVNLDLSGNSITNISSISSLNKLTNLNITGNKVNDNIINVLSGLTNLTQLNMTSTQLSDVSFISNLTNLQSLVLSNNNISNLEPVSKCSNITKLDVSKNTSFTTISQITSTLTGLKELNISGTGISELTGIDEIRGLEKIYAADNSRIITTEGVSPLYNTYKHENETVMCLGNLKTLDLSNIGITKKRPISVSNIAKLTSLEELRLASNELSNISGIEKLVNLKAIDLSNNKLNSDSIKKLGTLTATKIDLRKNEIIDVSVFGDYTADITYLDLSENHIYNITPLTKHSFSELLNLQRQDVIFGINKKKIDLDQYIILPSILTQSQIEGSIVYAGNTVNSLKYDNVTLNPDYTDPNQYNVIIDSEKTSADKNLKITLTGGTASGTVLTFQIGSKLGTHNGCLIESVLYKDENLENAVNNNLKSYPENIKKYFNTIPKILNANSELILAVKEFNFQHTDTSEETKIRDLTGLENFANLDTLQLQNNDIATIKQLEVCAKIQTLLLANNTNLGDNNSAIEKLIALSNLDLSNTGMTNINSIKNLAESLKTQKMNILNISGNGLTNIDGIEKITTLQKLYIANENLKDENINVLESLTNLTTLNMSGNQIENIDVLSMLSNLQYLYFSENKVESIEPIRGKVFYELEFSNNKVKDIGPLNAHGTINRLIMNNNKIEDITVLSNIAMTDDQVLSLAGQKITRTLDVNSTGDVTIELPKIFEAAKEAGNKIYTSSDFILTNCKLDSTGKNVIVNVDELGDNIAEVSIYGGKANGTTLSIAAPLDGKIQYNPSNQIKTNQDITATITFNRSNVTITNNDGKNTYTFTQNGEFIFKYIDESGFEGTATAVVNNIDKDSPKIVGEITKEIKNKQVIVTVTVNEKVKDIEGWTPTELTDGRMQLTKTYSKDANENIVLTDEAGNTTPLDIQVKIDTTAPVITGVENGKTYDKYVTPTIQDESEYTITLTKDGTTVENYKSGDEIKEVGQYVLTATDVFENTTTITFKIEIENISDIITSDTLKVSEEQRLIRGINPKTSISDLKKKFNTEMEYEILDKNGSKLSDIANIGTGCQIKMQNGKIYKVVVWGDLTGNGQILIQELARIAKIGANPTIAKDIEKMAIDINMNGKIELSELAAIAKLQVK